MKKTIFAASAMLSLIAGSAALAQQGGGRITFESLDADGDGVVTKEEFKANFNPPGRDGRAPDPEMVFGRWDADGNGEISAEEYENRPQRRQQ
ncbi:MAG: EF-hand domain-containing protein [Woeseiaceae bacterium]